MGVVIEGELRSVLGLFNSFRAIVGRDGMDRIG